MGVRKDVAKAREYYNEYFEYCKSLAEMGDNHAINRLGLIYSEGIGVEVDRTKAAEWYLKAADEGYRWAQYNLAIEYYEGIGIGQNINEAFNWCLKAAEQVLLMHKTW